MVIFPIKLPWMPTSEDRAKWKKEDKERSIEQIYEVYNASIKFINPPALFWKIWRVKKDIYGKKTNNRTIQNVGVERGKEDSPKGQRTLF